MSSLSSKDSVSLEGAENLLLFGGKKRTRDEIEERGEIDKEKSNKKKCVENKQKYIYNRYMEETNVYTCDKFKNKVIYQIYLVYSNNKYIGFLPILQIFSTSKYTPISKDEEKKLQLDKINKDIPSEISEILKETTSFKNKVISKEHQHLQNKKTKCILCVNSITEFLVKHSTHYLDSVKYDESCVPMFKREHIYKKIKGLLNTGNPKLYKFDSDEFKGILK